MISRRGLLGSLLAGAAALPAYGEAMLSSPRPRLRGEPVAAKSGTPKVTKSPEALISAAELGGKVAFIVVDAKTGELVEAYDPDAELPPASVTKSVTALYALDRLGAGRRFATRLLATGPVQGGVLQGDLILVGSGDPTLQTDQLGDLAAKLKNRGVSKITGRYLYWDAALPRLSQVADDQPVQVGYNPAISGLNLNFNRVHFEWKKAGGGYSLAMDARGERYLPKLDWVGMTLAQRDVPVFTYQGGAAREDWTVASAALGKGGTRWLPTRLPGLYAADVFRSLAKAQGIALPEGQPAGAAPQGDEIARVESKDIPEVLREMLRFSTNLTAECAGLAASGAQSLPASATAMSDWVRQTFGVTARFVDHSGLGGATRLSPAGMARIMVKAYADGRGLKPILRDVGMKDDAGKLQKSHPVKVLAKTGTLNFVSCLAGHIIPPEGRELIFAIFSGDPARRDAIPVAARDNPAGVEAWTKRARRLQGQLVNRWTALYV